MVASSVSCKYLEGKFSSKWGQFIEADENTLREQSYEKGRFLIAKENPDPIKGKLRLIIEGFKYVINVTEEDSFRIVKPKELSGLQNIGSKFVGEDDDDVEGEDNDKEFNKESAELSMDDMSKHASKAADMVTHTNKGTTIMGHSNQHAEVVGQVVMADTINEAIKGKNSVVPMPAESNAQDIGGSCNVETTNTTQDLDSIVEDSIAQAWRTSTQTLVMTI